MKNCCDNPNANGQDCDRESMCEEKPRPVLPITLRDGADGIYHTARETLGCFLRGEIDREDADTIFHGIGTLTNVAAFGEPLAQFHVALNRHQTQKQQEIANLRNTQRRIVDRLDQLLRAS